METILWWSIPVGVTLLAALWLALRNRPRGPADAHETVERYQRFRSALEGDRHDQRRRDGGRP